MDESYSFEVHAKDDISSIIDPHYNFSSILIRIDGKYIFKTGEKFDSYEDLRRRMDLHTKESSVFYWRRDSRTVERAFTKTARPIASKLKYYLVRFACIFGGMKFQTRGFGRRASQSMRTDCPAHVFLRASKCGKKLEVISVCNDHNHEVSERAVKLLPQNRRLHDTVREEVMEMLRLKVDKKKIIEYVQQRENKKITSKDLFNLSSRLKCNNDLRKNDQEKIRTVLQNIMHNTTDKSIRNTITNELSAYEPDPSVYYPVNNNEIVEYISPDHEFGVNETIIDSMVEARKREIDQQSWGEMQIKIKNEPDFSENNINNNDNDDDTAADNDDEGNLELSTNIFDDIIINESDTISISNYHENYTSSNKHSIKDDYDSSIYHENTHSIAVTSVTIDDLKVEQDICVVYSTEYSNSNSSSTAYEDLSTSRRSCDIDILEDPLSNNIANCRPSINTVNSELNTTKKLTKSQKRRNIANRVNKSLTKVRHCRKCGTSSYLLKEQINYLKARKNKLLTETNVLLLQKEKLKEEIKQLKSTL